MGGPATGKAIGPKLASLVAETMIKARTVAAPGEHAARARATTAQMEQWERELAEVARHLLGEVMADPDIDDETKAPLRTLTDPGHQVDFLLQVLAMPLALGALAQAAVAPLVENMRGIQATKKPFWQLSPETAALAVTKGELHHNDAVKMAAWAGLDEDRYNVIEKITGEPPGLQELLSAWQRGYIDEARLEKGVRQSRYRNEWLDVIKRLRFAPPGAGQVIAAAVEGHLSEAEAKKRVGEAGVDPANYEWLFETAGRPPGAEQMVELWRRGFVSKAEVAQSIRESDIKTKYVDTILKTFERLPPQDTIRSMVARGALTKERGTELMAQHGFPPDIAAALIAEATDRKNEKTKDLAQGAIIQLYRGQEIDRARAAGLLEGLGYDSDDAGFLLDLTDHERERQFRNAAIGRVHTLYVKAKLDRNEASNALDGFEVPSSQRDDLIRLWDLERRADVETLTVAQLTAAFKRQLITEERFLGDLIERGYTAEDADILLSLSAPAPRSPR